METGFSHVSESTTPVNFLVDHPPSIMRFLYGAEWSYALALFVASVVTCVTIGLSFFQIFRVYNFVKDDHIRNNLYYILALFPVFSTCSLVGMFLPRATLLLFTVCFAYVAVCLFVIVALMRELFGGRAAMSEYLSNHNQLISFAALPMCCCCKCCMKLEPTEANLRKVENIALQAPIVGITLQIANAAAFAEQDSFKIWKMVFELTAVASLLLGLYGCNIMVELGKARLQSYRFFGIYQFVNVSQIICTVQRPLLEMGFKIFATDSLLGAASKGMFWNALAIVIEMGIMSVFANYIMDPSHNALFESSEGENSESPALKDKKIQDA